ncbi:hypothetical protein BCR34DRAFT_97799 [Clohesyomyces aquaticus]|uniref:Uncharacterized protein n=1 Tax=Clohesyomyces aquaticus TaxID=1231657 RepID=A0A1Y1YUK9_9PLEO|nr:hypothetical protein BCR34DRAFT_97799 [Clohesyomyces aquaticus]
MWRICRRMAQSDWTRFPTLVEVALSLVCMWLSDNRSRPADQFSGTGLHATRKDDSHSTSQLCISSAKGCRIPPRFTHRRAVKISFAESGEGFRVRASLLLANVAEAYSGTADPRVAIATSTAANNWFTNCQPDKFSVQHRAETLLVLDQIRL